ncbi:MAG: type II secretion system GspH family protein, partial [Fusobacterium sp.]|nr:type II secretion system GspH family protein [Fusobacterium sp.]
AEQAFTMAEILLSLTIIGVVAAITLPSLTGNINERTWNTQRKALYARMSQAVLLMPAFNNYGTYIKEEKDESGSVVTAGVDNAAETFVTAGLSKVIKMNAICDNDHLSDCGISSTIHNLNGEGLSFPKNFNELNPWIETYGGGVRTKAAAFVTENGESVATYYNPNCVSEETSLDSMPGWKYSARLYCANFVFDLNGSKGPNTYGKDIGVMSLIYPSDPKLAMPDVTRSFIPEEKTWQEAVKLCRGQGSEYRLPNLEEAMSMFLNRRLLVRADQEQHLTGGQVGIWTGSKKDSKYYTVRFDFGAYNALAPSNNLIPWCVKR